MTGGDGADDELAHLREVYGDRGLRRADLASDPITQFRHWFADWTATDPYDANAVALATADGAGRPSVRFVLLKGLDTGFVFFTNTRSAKGTDLAANPNAALCFAWIALERQVRVTGTVKAVTAAEADAYFAGRPRGSQVGAWASDQSAVIADRDELERRWADAGERFPGDVPRPPHWGGYRVLPREVELWQGRPNRMHDRFRYRRPGEGEGDGWVIERLAP